MKVIIKCFAVFVVIVSIFLLFFQIKVNRELKAKNTTLSLEKEVLKTNNDTYEYLNSLTVESFEKKISNKNDLLVYIGNSECSDCSFFSKTLKNEVETFPLKNSLYLVDITKLHQNTKDWVKFKKKYGFEQTPAFLLFKGGKVKSMIQWNEKKGLSPQSFHNWLTLNGSDIQGFENENKS